MQFCLITAQNALKISPSTFVNLLMYGMILPQAEGKEIGSCSVSNLWFHFSVHAHCILIHISQTPFLTHNPLTHSLTHSPTHTVLSTTIVCVNHTLFFSRVDKSFASIFADDYITCLPQICIYTDP